ncbi:hypothetical protein CBE79_26560 [Priestia megaterium]|nr:hypothetical protein CBE79_26560 [Priestia megaterium]
MWGELDKSQYLITLNTDLLVEIDGKLLILIKSQYLKLKPLSGWALIPFILTSNDIAFLKIIQNPMFYIEFMGMILKLILVSSSLLKVSCST